MDSISDRLSFLLNDQDKKEDSSTTPASKEGEGIQAEDSSVYIEALKCTLDDVDRFLAEAVSKDRLLCLRIAEQLDNMFTSGSSVATITTSESYQRKICYNAAVYYNVEYSVDGHTLVFRRLPTSHPDTRLRTLLDRVAPPAAPPVRVIIARRHPASKSSSSQSSQRAERDDGARSESGRDSRGSGSAQSIEEKQERYRQTRERIFGDFVPQPEEPLQSSTVAAPPAVEPKMEFPEVARDAAPRSRSQGLFNPSQSHTDSRPASSFTPASRAPITPVAPLLSFGAGSHVWSRAHQPADPYGQGPPLVRPEMHGFGGMHNPMMAGGPAVHHSSYSTPMQPPRGGGGAMPPYGRGYPPYASGYPAPYFTPMGQAAPPMYGLGGAEPRRYPPANGYDQPMRPGSQMHMHHQGPQHDYRMYSAQQHQQHQQHQQPWM